jgi:hypothetical protein
MTSLESRAESKRRAIHPWIAWVAVCGKNALCQAAQRNNHQTSVSTLSGELTEPTSMSTLLGELIEPLPPSPPPPPPPPPRWSIACSTPAIDAPSPLLRGSTRPSFLSLDSDDNPESLTNIYVVLLGFFTTFLSSDLGSSGG